MIEDISRPITKEDPFRLCFVCLGNICRSPTAEGLFIHQVKNEGFQDFFYIDSAGTAAYHVGEPANSKSQSVANQYGVILPSRARKFEYSDLEEFELILAMDSENYRNLVALDRKDQYSHKVRMMRDFDPQPENNEVPDPYYGGMDGFENVYRVLERSSQALLEQLKVHIRQS